MGSKEASEVPKKPQVSICTKLIKSHILLHLQPLVNFDEDASLIGGNPLCLYIAFIAKYPHLWASLMFLMKFWYFVF